MSDLSGELLAEAAGMIGWQVKNKPEEVLFHAARVNLRYSLPQAADGITRFKRSSICGG